MNSLLHRQRGIFGLSLLVSLAIYAGLAAAALAAIYAFDKSRQAVGAQRIEAKYAPVAEACRAFADKISPADCAGHMRVAIADRDTALAANAALQADVKRLDTERQACSNEVTRLEQRGARAAAAAAARKPADDKRLAEIAPEREDMVRVWGQPKPAMSCEQELAARDAMLKKTAEQRARDFPPTNPPPAGGGLRLSLPTEPPRPPPVNPLVKPK
jgi:cell division protein FtsL